MSGRGEGKARERGGKRDGPVYGLDGIEDKKKDENGGRRPARQSG